MRRSLREREMTPTSSKSISVSAITKTTAATTIMSIPSSDSMTIINTKIENATEGYLLTALTVFLTWYYLHLEVKKMF
jgi:hypothetical protein